MKKTLVMSLALTLAIFASCNKKDATKKGMGTGPTPAAPITVEAAEEQLGRSETPQVTAEQLKLEGIEVSTSTGLNAKSGTVELNYIQGGSLGLAETDEVKGNNSYIMWNVESCNGGPCAMETPQAVVEYDFHTFPIVGLAKGEIKFAARLCVSSLKFIVEKDRAKFQNNCSDQAPCFCGEPIYKIWNNTGTLETSDEAKKAIATVRADKQDLVALCRDYINQSNKFIAKYEENKCTDASQLVYAQNISVYSPAEMALISDEYGEVLNAVLQQTISGSGTDTSTAGTTASTGSSKSRGTGSIVGMSLGGAVIVGAVIAIIAYGTYKGIKKWGTTDGLKHAKTQRKINRLEMKMKSAIANNDFKGFRDLYTQHVDEIKEWNKQSTKMNASNPKYDSKYPRSQQFGEILRAENAKSNVAGTKFSSDLEFYNYKTGQNVKLTEFKNTVSTEVRTAQAKKWGGRLASFAGLGAIFGAGIAVTVLGATGTLGLAETTDPACDFRPTMNTMEGKILAQVKKLHADNDALAKILGIPPADEEEFAATDPN